MGRQRRLALSGAQLEELEAYRDHDGRADIRERCAALLKIASGRSPHWVAKQGLLKERDPDAVYRWMAFYEQGGGEALIAHRHGGPGRRSV